MDNTTEFDPNEDEDHVKHENGDLKIEAPDIKTESESENAFPPVRSDQRIYYGMARSWLEALTRNMTMPLLPWSRLRDWPT